MAPDREGTYREGTDRNGKDREGTGYDLISRQLLACEAEHLSGALRVAGEPGGLIHLRGGNVTAVETSGAPGPELVLVASHRVTEASWTAAFAMTAPGGHLGPELVKRGLIGEGELEAMLKIALADAMFATVAGRVDGCAIEYAPAAPLLPLDPPASPDWLLTEIARRLRALASTPAVVRHDQDRVTAAIHGRPAGDRSLARGQDDIIALANGRRTARDMAFVLGRGVYSLSLELTRMREAGLLSVTSQRALPQSPAPEPGLTDGSLPNLADSRPEPTRGPAGGLPRRHQPGRQARPGPAEVMPPPASALSRLLRLFPPGDRESGGPADAGTTS